MGREQPIVACAFGWGRVFRLYPDYLDVNGTHYALTNLTRVCSIYRHVMGIPSVRLELQFGRKKVILRGIAALEDAQAAVEYLTSSSSGFEQSNATGRLEYVKRSFANQVSLQHADDQREQSVLPNSISSPSEGSGEHIWSETEWSRHSDADRGDIAVGEAQIWHPLDTDLQGETTLTTSSWPAYQDICLKEFAEAMTPRPPVEAPNWQRLCQEQRELRQELLRIERSMREYTPVPPALAQRQDGEKAEQDLPGVPPGIPLGVPLADTDLPDVPVPLRLLPDEQAYYSTDATLCGEPIGGPMGYTYPAKDHGTLILTNLRMIYIGHQSQLVLEYARLLQVSRLRGAITFQADHWPKRKIFEVHQPLECMMYLGCIIQRFQQEGQIHDTESQELGERIGDVRDTNGSMEPGL